MKFEFRLHTLPEYIKYIEDKFKDETLLTYSKHQIAEDSPQATGKRISIKELVDLFGDKRTQEMIEEALDKGAALFKENEIEIIQRR